METQIRLQRSFAARKDQLLATSMATLYLMQLQIAYQESWFFIGIGAFFWGLGKQQFSSSLKKFLIAILSLMLILLLLNTWSEPASAVFLSRLQDFFSSSFGQNAGAGEDFKNLIDLICNSIRAIYLIFLAGAIIQAWQDHNRGEEMSTYSRIFIGSLVGVFGFDVISTFIIPTGNV